MTFKNKPTYINNPFGRFVSKLSFIAIQAWGQSIEEEKRNE